jgi:hypothetical protein
MAANKGSKNNVSNRGKSSELKKLDGKTIKPIFYKGERAGHGNYMAAKFENGALIRNEDGIPIPYQTI